MAQSNSKEVAVRLTSDVSKYRGIREDDRSTEFAVSIPSTTNGGENLVVTVEEGKRKGMGLASGGDITTITAHHFPDIGRVDVILGVRGIPVDASEAFVEGITRNLLELTGRLNANKENTDR